MTTLAHIDKLCCHQSVLFDPKYHVVFPELIEICINTTYALDKKSSIVGIIAKVIVGVFLVVAIAVGVTVYCLYVKKKLNTKNMEGIYNIYNIYPMPGPTFDPTVLNLRWLM